MTLLVAANLFLIFLCGLLNLSHGRLPTEKNPALLVISFDSFTPKYWVNHLDVMPGMAYFRDNGVYAHMTPVMPTKTLTNHFSMATGNNYFLHFSLCRFLNYLRNHNKYTRHIFACIRNLPWYTRGNNQEWIRSKRR